MASPGQILRLARERQGRPLEDVAQEIKVSAHYLEAIEEGDLSRLPGGFFTRSFVRQYARALSIPSEQIDSQLEKWLAEQAPLETPPLEPRTMETGLAPIMEVAVSGRRRRNRTLGAVAALVAVAGACAVVYSLWFVESFPTGAPEPPPVEAPPEPPPAATVQAPRPGAGRAGLETRAPAVAAPQGPLWFEIAARETTWVRVKAADRTLFEGILEPGEKRRFEGLTLAAMRVGNAGGLLLSVNGRPYGPLGPAGHIRTVTLTPDKIEVAAPPVPRPAGIAGAEAPPPQDEDGPE